MSEREGMPASYDDDLSREPGYVPLPEGDEDDDGTESALYPEIVVELSGHDGNAATIMNRVARALRRAGHADEVPAFMAEARSGDYGHVLETCEQWVTIY